MDDQDAGSAWSPTQIARATTLFVALGIGLRLVCYLLNMPLWCDESMIAANFLNRGYLDLLRPLDYRQVAPILFLWAERSAVGLFGFTELSLRLVPVACAVASVPLFRHVAGRMLSGLPLLLAVAVFAVSGWPIRFGAQVKPYAGDLLVALALLALALEWLRKPEEARWLWALAAFAPVALGSSYPAVFIAGGIGLALLVPVWNRRNAWPAFAAFLAAVALSFLALLSFFRPSPENQGYFLKYWSAAFPPRTGVVPLLGWLWKAHTGSLFAYPEGGEHSASLATTCCVLVGVVSLWRRRERTALALLLTPFGLGLIAATIRRYPYGQSIRTMQYLAPSVCLLAAVGGAALLGRLRSVRRRGLALNAVLGGLVALAAGRAAFDLVHPYPNPTDERGRAFARWFWTEMERDAEVACLKTDLGRVFRAEHWNRDATDSYLCNMKIYSPRHHRGLPLRLDAVSEARPLRCVLFNEVPRKIPGFDAWLAEMGRSYELRKVNRFPVSAVENRPGVYFDSLYFVYEFVPKPPGVAAIPTTPLKKGAEF